MYAKKSNLEANLLTIFNCSPEFRLFIFNQNDLNQKLLNKNFIMAKFYKKLLYRVKMSQKKLKTLVEFHRDTLGMTKIKLLIRQCYKIVVKNN